MHNMYRLIEVYLHKSPNEQVGEENETDFPDEKLLGHLEEVAQPPSLVAIFLPVIIFCSLLAVFLLQLKNVYIKKVTKYLPASSLIVLAGMFASGITKLGQYIYFSETKKTIEPVLPLSFHWFQHVLIFPIILHTSYSLYTVQFIRQFRAVLFFSITGFAMNIIIIGLFLRYVYATFDADAPQMNVFHCFSFATVISTIDPVSVLTVIKDPRIGNTARNLLFSESLISYGIAYELIQVLNHLAVIPETQSIPAENYLIAFGSVVTDIFGGLTIGNICGLLSAMITKLATSESEYFEPTVAISTAVFSYIISLDFGFSPIFSVIFCATVQRRYTFMNMTAISHMSTRNFVQGVSLIAEIIVFILLGNEVLSIGSWNWWSFIVSVLAIIFISRFISTISICFFFNAIRERKIVFLSQLLLFFGGMRGPVVFALIMNYQGPFHRLYQDTVIIVFLVTFVIGGVVSNVIFGKITMLSGEKESGLKEVLKLACKYGGDEIDTLLGGVAGTADRGIFAQFVYDFEARVYKFFVDDEEKLSNIYRLHKEAEEMLFMRRLEKHSYLDMIKDPSDEPEDSVPDHIIMNDIEEEPQWL